MIGISFEFTWSYENGTARQIEVGPHPGAHHEAFFMGKTRRVGTRYESDSIVFWSPSDLSKEAETIFIGDLDTLLIRKITP